MISSVEALVREALNEDIGKGDVTTASTIPEDACCQATLLAKEGGVLSGITVFRNVFDILDAAVSEWTAMADGAAFAAGDRLAAFTGNMRAVLTGERVALNFVQQLSGNATATAAFVDAVKGMNVKICDTRKTTPLLRTLEKEAVVHGGGANHRAGLFDGVLIKENHIVGAGGIQHAVRQAIDQTHHLMKIGIEVTSVAEFDEAIQAGADAILLDNMDLEEIRRAVAHARDKNVVLEVSGNVTLDRVRAIAETGVDVISIGKLTHSAPAVDLSLAIANV